MFNLIFNNILTVKHFILDGYRLYNWYIKVIFAPESTVMTSNTLILTWPGYMGDEFNTDISQI